MLRFFGLLELMPADLHDLCLMLFQFPLVFFDQFVRMVKVFLIEEQGCRFRLLLVQAFGLNLGIQSLD